VAPGTSGPDAWYCRTDGDSTAQVPATGGLTVGMGLPGPRSVENCTEMVDPAATLVPVGDTETTLSAGGGAVGVAAAWLKCRFVTTMAAAATTSTASTNVHLEVAVPGAGRVGLDFDRRPSRPDLRCLHRVLLGAFALDDVERETPR